MKLEEVKKLREEARVSLQALSQTFGLDGAKTESETIPTAAVTLGIGTRREHDDYELAVRIRTAMPNLEFQKALARLLVKRSGSPADIDIQYTGPVYALAPLGEGTRTDGQLCIGSSISHIETRAGTLSFFARDRNGVVGFVSANHVIGRQDRAHRGDRIVHPGGDPHGTPVGRFAHAVELCNGGEKFVDCAFATLDHRNFDPSTLPNDEQLDARIADLTDSSRSVRKIGSRSKLTYGRVTSFNHDDLRVLAYRVPIVSFEDQIEVQAARNEPFGVDGDSGALVYNDQQRPVGLLFGVTKQGGLFNRGFAYVNPMQSVLCRLGVELLTTVP